MPLLVASISAGFKYIRYVKSYELDVTFLTLEKGEPRHRKTKKFTVEQVEKKHRHSAGSHRWEGPGATPVFVFALLQQLPLCPCVP